jgi:hypothetical protein
MPSTAIYGLLAEFLTAQEILDATRSASEAGYRQMDAYAPYAVEGLAAELGMRRTRIPSVVLCAGLIGAGVGFFMQYWSMAVDYPFNVGGRPLNSWPVFIPITFELLVLVASFAAFLGMLFLNGLPHPHHPLFNVPRFARASQDRFFLCIEATDPLFDAAKTAEFLERLAPHGPIVEVPHYQIVDAPPASGERVAAAGEAHEAHAR